MFNPQSVIIIFTVPLQKEEKNNFWQTNEIVLLINCWAADEKEGLGLFIYFIVSIKIYIYISTQHVDVSVLLERS